MRPRRRERRRHVVLHVDVRLPRVGLDVPRFGRRLRRRRDLHGLERDVSRRRVLPDVDGLPLGGRRLRPRRELPRQCRRVPGRCQVRIG